MPRTIGAALDVEPAASDPGELVRSLSSVPDGWRGSVPAGDTEERHKERSAQGVSVTIRWVARV